MDLDFERLRKRHGPGHVRDGELDAYVFERRAPPEVASHVQECGLCRHRAEELAARATRFRAAHPRPDWLRRRAPRSTSPRRWTLMFGALGLALAASLALFLRQPASDDDVRWKGVAEVGLGLELLASRTPPGPGDALRFHVTAPRDGFVMVLGVDARGEVHRYFPAAESTSAPVPRGGGILPGSVELDHSPDEEVVALVFSDRPLAEGVVSAALSRGFLQSGLSLEAFELEGAALVSAPLLKRGAEGRGDEVLR